MSRTTDLQGRLGIVLAATVFAATGIGGLLNTLLPKLMELVEVDMISGIFLINAMSPFLHALLPLAFVYGVCRQIGGVPLPARTITIISLTATVLGRYVGVSVGYVLLGNQLPTPLVLVSSSDLAAREFGVVMWIGVVLGILGIGLWGTVGTFGGLGLVTRSSKAE